jgi:hypothetical protein
LHQQRGSKREHQPYAKYIGKRCQRNFDLEIKFDAQVKLIRGYKRLSLANSNLKLPLAAETNRDNAFSICGIETAGHYRI